MNNGHQEPATAQEVDLVSEIAARYSIDSLGPAVSACRSAFAREELNVAVLGRFKAGKSSFLNHFVGRDLLPVGAIPVTSVVTELVYNAQAEATVFFRDGKQESTPLSSVATFVSEKENPENVKEISRVVIAVPELESCQGLRFIDTPGLESTSGRNTETSLRWAPNLDMAVVAVGVDPPLTEHDVELIRKLFDYTPKISVLLTKVDLVSADELSEVLAFVREQIERSLTHPVAVFPYSNRRGFENLRDELRRDLFSPALASLAEEQHAIRAHKLRALLTECADYLQIILRSAEQADEAQRQLQLRALAGRETLSDALLQLQLSASHAIGLARAHMDGIFATHEKSIAADLARIFEAEFPTWKMSLAALMEWFQEWIEHALGLRLRDLSASHQSGLLQPVRDAQRQCRHIQQAFRDQVSQRALELFGVPLRTAELETIAPPLKAPDLKIGRIFDHNWELISPVIPMPLIRGSVQQRLLEKVEYETHKNLSRLANQWSEIATEMIASVQKEAAQRLEQLVETVERLAAPAESPRARIELDLRSVRQWQKEIEKEEVYEH